MERAEPIAVYVHTPFCPTKCGYCDFNSFAMKGAIHEQTVRAMVHEIDCSPLHGRPAKTIFFGGGTPTFLKASQLERLLKAVIEAHPPTESCEITSEANPGTVDIPKFAAMRAMGFNRISMGAQSFLDSDLERLGRVHRSTDIERAFQAAKEAGLDNVNLDLMFALPGQSRGAWRENLNRAISLGPDHLSLYCLTLEPNTPFYKEHLRGALVLPDDDVQVAMYEDALALSADAGFLQYEISNFAKLGYECRHNLAYWRYEEYAGYGPGAVGCFDCGLGAVQGDEGTGGPRGDGTEGLATGARSSGVRIRYTNLKHPARYSQIASALRKPFTDPPITGSSDVPSPMPPHPRSLRSRTLSYEGRGHPPPHSLPDAPSHPLTPVHSVHGPSPTRGEGVLPFISSSHHLFTPSTTHSLTDSPSPLWCEWEPLDAHKEKLERIMLGIRLNEGLPLASLSLSESEISNLRTQIGRLEARGWVEWAGEGVIRLTPDGRHFCSEVALTLA
ncbi:MAG: radical SAM family heme chaperone HemW [Armatimonadetes bacterium]|nr:radical SAM family heme chaperone HemW [Armatimonadota bacterium]